MDKAWIQRVIGALASSTDAMEYVAAEGFDGDARVRMSNAIKENELIVGLLQKGGFPRWTAVNTLPASLAVECKVGRFTARVTLCDNPTTEHFGLFYAAAGHDVKAQAQKEFTGYYPSLGEAERACEGYISRSKESV